MDNIIKIGDYVIIQRQEYYKLEKLERRTITRIKNKDIDLSSIVGKPFFSTFKVINNPDKPNSTLYTLQEAKDVKTINEISIDRSGLDNRSIVDDGQSQTLTKEEIEKLQETSDSTNDLVETIINNSRTFNSKTKYCQTKYLKKKEKKYFEYIQVRKPSVRLLTDMASAWGNDSNVGGLRAENIASILTAANVHSDGTYILHDGGTKGLLTAALMDRIGASTKGRLLYLHPGNQCQRRAFDAMDFPEEQIKRCYEVNLYSILRCFYQHSNEIKEADKSEPEPANNIEVGAKRKAEDEGEMEKKKTSWQIENEKVRRIFQETKADSLIIVTRTFPENLIEELLPFVKFGGVLVVYSQFNQILMQVYSYLKKRTDVINIRLSSTSKSKIQVIEDVTHPEINKTYGGYVLSAYKIAV